MLTCIARSKQPDETDESNLNRATTPANKQAIKTLTSQVGIPYTFFSIYKGVCNYLSFLFILMIITYTSKQLIIKYFRR